MGVKTIQWGKGQCFQQTALGHRDIHMLKNEAGPLSHSSSNTQKQELKLQNSEENITVNLCELESSNCFLGHQKQREQKKK